MIGTTYSLVEDSEQKRVIPLRENGLKMVKSGEGLVKIVSWVCIFISLLIIWTGTYYTKATQALQVFGLTYWIWLLIDIIIVLLDFHEKLPDFLNYYTFLSIVLTIYFVGIIICSFSMITSQIGSLVASGILALVSQATLITWLIKLVRIIKGKVTFV